MRAVVAGALAVMGAASAPGAMAADTQMRQSFDPVYEATNFAKTNERALRLTALPDYQVQLRVKGTQRELEALQILATDGPAQPYGRNFAGQLCWQHMDGCAGDVRLYDWAANGYGTVVPVLYTARNGSTISGHVWSTKAGPAKKPGIVITSGSVQAPEELYWFAAQTLAKAGYVVLTWDAQGQGYSDTFGEGVDQQDGFPSQTGEPFFNGTEDALDFFFSAPGSEYHPRKSCSTGTSHDAKQVARVKDGRNSAFNPYFAQLDPTRVGVLGQSLGASAVSYIGQLDPRVKAIVAMDNLSAPATAPAKCASTPASRPDNPVFSKPALGLTNDYALFEQAKTQLPDPKAKQAASRKLSDLGIDTGSVVVRGGTHFEGAFIPNAGFTATLRGNDLYAWYLRAWFDKYVKGDPSADARLLTDRWRHDDLEAAADLTGDGNQNSQYYFSRMAITRTDGTKAVCENLRDGCPAIVPDGGPVPYSFLKDVTTKDAPGGGPSDQAAGGSDGSPPGGQATGSGDPACRDRTAPVTRPSRKGSRVTRTGLRLSGTASDKGCGAGKAGRLTQVTVSVARRKAGRCSFLRQNGTFGPPTACTRAPYIFAKGTSRWTLTQKLKLTPGLYTVVVRSVDAAGNLERWISKRNVLRLRVR